MLSVRRLIGQKSQHYSQRAARTVAEQGQNFRRNGTSLLTKDHALVGMCWSDFIVGKHIANVGRLSISDGIENEVSIQVLYGVADTSL